MPKMQFNACGFIFEISLNQYDAWKHRKNRGDCGESNDNNEF